MKIQRIQLPYECRVVAVSDIHTHGKLLEALLEKNCFDYKEDYLIIIGDILEHGGANLETLHIIMKLCENEKTFMTLGNNDLNILMLAFDDDYNTFSKYVKRRPNNCYSEMGAALGIMEFTESGFDKQRQLVNNAFAKELDFLKSLPIAIETDNHIFVHAGIENRSDWENTSDDFALNAPFWLNCSHSSDKTVVVGHYPTYNYRESNNSNFPIFNTEKRMICIDGGLGVKWASQLNMLNIHKKADSYSYDVLWDTPVPKRTALREYKGMLSPIFYNWAEYDCERLSEKDGFAEIGIVQTGETGLLLPERIFDYGEGKLRIWENLSAFPKVRVGSKASVFGEIRDLLFIINEDGQVGWVPSDIFE